MPAHTHDKTARTTLIFTIHGVQIYKTTAVSEPESFILSSFLVQQNHRQTEVSQVCSTDCVPAVIDYGTGPDRRLPLVGPVQQAIVGINMTENRKICTASTAHYYNSCTSNVKSACVYLLLVCHCIGEYISLELFHFVSLTSSSPLSPERGSCMCL